MANNPSAPRMLRSERNHLKGLMNFINASPTPYHAVMAMADSLELHGCHRLFEGEKWRLRIGKRYYVIRGDSSLVAFRYMGKVVAERGIRLIGAHTDSPCLKVKPSPELLSHQCLRLGVEVYGGVLLSTWFDRDLSIAGRVCYLNKQGQVCSKLIDFERAVAMVPSLAIHLDREANDKHSINKQKHLPPIILQPGFSAQSRAKQGFNDLLKAVSGKNEIDKVLSHDLFFYDVNRAATYGYNNEFLASARLDNLLSCFVGLQAFLDSGDDSACMLVCSDHEEVGSASATGAAGTFLSDTLTRIVPGGEDFYRTMAKSILISADNAHAVHPNFSEKHDENHMPVLNGGPVIKINANQRYATGAPISGLFQELCREVEVPVQQYVTRTDMGCGSTIGPITATKLGIATIDIGVPTLGMHSIRETAGVRDPFYLWKTFRRFFH